MEGKEGKNKGREEKQNKRANSKDSKSSAEVSMKRALSMPLLLP